MEVNYKLIEGYFSLKTGKNEVSILRGTQVFLSFNVKEKNIRKYLLSLDPTYIDNSNTQENINFSDVKQYLETLKVLEIIEISKCNLNKVRNVLANQDLAIFATKKQSKLLYNYLNLDFQKFIVKEKDFLENKGNSNNIYTKLDKPPNNLVLITRYLNTSLDLDYLYSVGTRIVYILIEPNYIYISPILCNENNLSPKSFEKIVGIKNNEKIYKKVIKIQETIDKELSLINVNIICSIVAKIWEDYILEGKYSDGFVINTHTLEINLFTKFFNKRKNICE